MSNSLAIAAVTETLRSILVAGLRNEITNEDRFTVKPPDKARGDDTDNQINIFLYQTVPNATFNNADIPGQTRSGESSTPPLALNLYYLITAYGEDDDDRGSHLLLGKAMSVFHDHPVLGREVIENALTGNDLHQQPERVRIIPQPMSLDESSKLWNSFQTNYRISATYQVSVVLIESTRPSTSPMPVLARGQDDRGVIAIAEQSPFLSEVLLPNGKPGAELGDQLIIRGDNLSSDSVTIRFRHPLLDSPNELVPVLKKITVDGNPEWALAVTLPSTSDDPQAPSKWPIGFYAVTAVVSKPGLPNWASNALSLALVATAQLTDPPPTADPPPEVNAGDIDVTLTCIPQIQGDKQRVELLFGNRIIPSTAVTNPAGDIGPSKIDFKIEEVDGRVAPYTLRLRVDSVDSISVDFTQTPPAFDPKLQIKVI